MFCIRSVPVRTYRVYCVVVFFLCLLSAVSSAAAMSVGLVPCTNKWKQWDGWCTDVLATFIVVLVGASLELSLSLSRSLSARSVLWDFGCWIQFVEHINQVILEYRAYFFATHRGSRPFKYLKTYQVYISKPKIDACSHACTPALLGRCCRCCCCCSAASASAVASELLLLLLLLFVDLFSTLCGFVEQTFFV